MIEDTQLVLSLETAGLLDAERIRSALGLAEDSGQSLYHILIDRQFLSEKALIDLVSSMISVPALVLGSRPFDKIVEMVPGVMARRLQVLPLAVTSEDGRRALVLAMADPLDVAAMDEVSSHTRIDIQPVLVGPIDLNQAIDRAYTEDALLTDDLFEAMELEDVVDESWDGYFEGELVEDSAVISQALRDRPNSGVLDEGSEGDSDEALRALEDSDPRQSAEMIAALDAWDVDNEIDAKPETSQILSKGDAEEHFTTDKEQAAVDDDETGRFKRNSDHTETGNIDDSSLLDETGNHTSVGLGFGLDANSEAGRVRVPEKKKEGLRDRTLEHTGRTNVGVGLDDTGQGVDDETGVVKKKTRGRQPTPESGTDYQALGRMILKGASGQKARPPHDDAPATRDVPVEEIMQELDEDGDLPTPTEKLSSVGSQTDPLQNVDAIVADRVDKQQKSQSPARESRPTPQVSRAVKAQELSALEAAFENEPMGGLGAEETAARDAAAMSELAQISVQDDKEGASENLRETRPQQRAQGFEDGDTKPSADAIATLQIPADLDMNALLAATVELLAQAGLLDPRELIARARELSQPESEES